MQIFNTFLIKGKPTSNGQVCTQPYFLNDIDNYFCSVDENTQGNLVCGTNTNSDEFGDCKLGNFKKKALHN